MVTPSPEPVSVQIPFWTLVLVGSSILVYILPGMASHLVYDRPAILAGEWWRLVTGNWVHFSASHLFIDLLAFGLASWMIKWCGYPHYGGLCALSALLVGLGVLIFQPDLKYYGGLSGVACAAIVYLVLCGLREPGLWGWVCAAGFLLTIGKILLESVTGQCVLAQGDEVSFVPVPLSHMLGGGSAFIFWLLSGPAPVRPKTLSSQPAGYLSPPLA